MRVDSAIRTLTEFLSTAQSGQPSVRGEWLTADEAVKYLGFPSRKALYQAIRRAQVPVHRLGRRLRFHRPELDQILKGAAR
jgi:excisionase family DNA binding protein